MGEEFLDRNALVLVTGNAVEAFEISRLLYGFEFLLREVDNVAFAVTQIGWKFQFACDFLNLF